MHLQGWGLTVILGIHPTPRLLPLHPMELFDGRRMVGCVFGDFKGKSHLPEFVEKYMKGVCIITSVISFVSCTLHTAYVDYIHGEWFTGCNL